MGHKTFMMRPAYIIPCALTEKIALIVSKIAENKLKAPCIIVFFTGQIIIAAMIITYATSITCFHVFFQ